MGHSLAVSDVTAFHGHGSRRQQALAQTSLHLAAGESVAVVGPSGAGKSTLADIVLGLHQPASGQVSVNGAIWCSATHRADHGHRHLVQGVPQDPAASFVPRWTIRQSLAQAVFRLTGARGQDAERGIRHAAELAHLDPELLARRPSELSGGQAQRAAITRALAVHPAVLVADEPTSALDTATAASVATALLACIAETSIALLLVTHDPEFAARCTRRVSIAPPTRQQEK